MRVSKRISAVAAAMVMAAGGATVVTAPQAQAAGLPSCMNLYVNKVTGSVQINAGECSRTRYVKVVWAWGADSACKAVVPFAYNNYPKPNRFARFDYAFICA